MIESAKNDAKTAAAIALLVMLATRPKNQTSRVSALDDLDTSIRGHIHPNKAYIFKCR